MTKIKESLRALIFNKTEGMAVAIQSKREPASKTGKLPYLSIKSVF